MGGGIAQVAVAHGLDVALYDAAPAALERGAARVRAGLERGVERGHLREQERDAALARLHSASTLDDVAAAPFVIEAVPEDLELKRTLFATLGHLGATGHQHLQSQHYQDCRRGRAA
jgi:3-hydroxybutyryl-CoA dehydrogenase